MSENDHKVADKMMCQLHINTKIRLFYQKDNPNNGLYHVRGIVDGEQVIMRFWSRKYGGHWAYKMESKWWLVANHEHITIVQPASDDRPEPVEWR